MYVHTYDFVVPGLEVVVVALWLTSDAAVARFSQLNSMALRWAALSVAGLS